MKMKMKKRTMCVMASLCLYLSINAQCVLINTTDFDGGSGPIYTMPYECPQGVIHCDAGPNGHFAQGDAYIKYGTGNNNQLKKPFVFVEGLDLDIANNYAHRHGARGWPNFITGTTDEKDLTEKVFEKAPLLITELIARGYDVIYLDHSNGGTYMQDNAQVFVDLIKKINQQKVGNEQIIVAGASMGGQTAKYGISLMESQNYKHCIADYISIDSPHLGANIPLGFQSMIKEYKFLSPQLETVYNGLSLPAAQQLLLKHYESSVFNAPHGERTTWLNDLNAVGNFPKYCRKVAITSGNVLGAELFPGGSKLLDFQVDPISGSSCSGTPNIVDVNVYSQPGNSNFYVLDSKRPKGATVAEIVSNNVACNSPAGCPSCLIDPESYFAFKQVQVTNTSLRLDNCPGGKRNTAKQFVDKIEAKIGNGAFANSITNISYSQEFHSFIPTISGLAVNTTDLFENVQSFIGSNSSPVPSKYPFDSYYGETGENKFHVEITGDPQSGNIKWILDEATKIKTPIANPLTNAAPNNGTYNYARYENRYVSGLVIGNGGKLLVNANLKSEYGQNTPPPYLTFATTFPPLAGSTYTMETCYCENVIVTVDNNGEFIIGDNNGTNNNKAVVLFHDGSKLFVKNGGKLTIRKGSKLIMEKNTILTLEQGGQIFIEQGAEIIIKGTSQFISSGLVTINGGKITQEPLSKLDLNGTSKLVVNDNSQVIIQADLSNANATNNGLLTYNQGAIIQLKGNNAVLEINGKLHIGNNAIFEFTYPGSNSGYIKFNRGTQWWDNGAANNAHITCGTNAKINLVGQSKTDKMLDISQINVAIPKNLVQLTMTKCLVEFNEHGARLETDRPTFINNSTFKGNSLDGNGAPDPRGLLMFGQQYFNVINCEFNGLGIGVYGALFYGGVKMSNVRQCNFVNCGSSIITEGAGCNITNNTFLNNDASIQVLDNIYNSSIKNNTINSTRPLSTITDHDYAEGSINNFGVMVFGGSNAVTEINQNTINNVDNAISVGNSEVKIKCNDLQNNMLALWGYVNGKVNMSDDLGAGFNIASNNTQFGFFNEASYFEANNGYNAFDISDGSACYRLPSQGPQHIPGKEVCPVITSGSLINFTSQNMIDAYYEVVAENNFWRPITSPANASIEEAYNTVFKKNYNTNGSYNTRVVTGNALWSPALTACPGSGCTGPACRTNNVVHPLDDNSNSSNITTASFYNKKLQKALKFSLNKMDKLQNAQKVNDAADLFTEILKANYVTPVKNPVDKYLLDLAYQKLFACVAQLTEWQRDSALINTPVPNSLQNRYADLRTIISLRINRKDITEQDAKEINDLVYLDKAMVYRLEEKRTNAITELNTILANQPKAEHLNLYQTLLCVWTTEEEAITNKITVDEAITRLNECYKKYGGIKTATSHSAQRVSKVEPENKVTYANEHTIAVYPNPTNGNLSVMYSLNEFKNITLEIFDVQGKLMNIYHLNPEDKIINIDNLNLQNGVYFYIIKGDEKTLMAKKLVVVE